MYPHVRREQRDTRLVNSEKEGAGRLVQELQTHIACYVRGGVQQTGPSARLGHTPPGFTNGRQRQTGSEIGDGSETSEERASARKSCDLRSNIFRGPGGHVRIDVNSQN